MPGRESYHPAAGTLILVCLLGILGLVCVLFAALPEFAVLLATVGSGVICLLAGYGLLLRHSPLPMPQGWPYLLAAGGALLGWAYLQTLPLGLGDAGVLGGYTFLHRQESVAGIGAYFSSISVKPFASQQALHWLCIYVLFFVSGFICGVSYQTCRRFLFGFLALQALLGGLALLIVLSPALSAVFNAYADGRLAASFPTANSYAAFVGMGLCVCVAILGAPSEWQGRVRRSSIALLGAFLLALLIGSGARGATACALIAAGGLAIFVLPRRLAQRRRLVVFSAILLMIIMALMASVWLRGTAGDALEAINARFDLSALAWRIFLGQPWLGIGLGGFADVAPAYFEAARTAARPLAHAHNGYLEAIISLGFGPASVLFLILACIAASASQLGRAPSVISAVCVGTSLQVFLLSWVDVPLAVPAICMAWLFILGSGVSQALQRQVMPAELTDVSGA